MKTEILIIGDEVVSGMVADTNSAVIARHLAGIGIETQRVVRVRDEDEAIKKVVAGALVASRLIFICGGLGPTPDDRTLNSVAELIERKLVVHQPSLERINRFFSRRGLKTPEPAKRQALIIEGAKVFENPAGMVPGTIVEHQGSTIVLLPGVPQEMEALLTGAILPHLKRRFSVTNVFEHQFRTFGLIESKIAPQILRRARRHQDVTVGFYPGVSGVDIILRGPDARELKSCAVEIRRFLRDAIYTEGNRSLAEVLGELLRGMGLTIATAESCTGGLIGDLLTNVPGSSDYYLGGVVAYSNRTKMQVLGVNERTLKSYGAVSSQTVKEMATGVCRVIGSDCGIAVSGIAGPAGGTKDKPVGLVYIAVTLDSRVKVEKHRFAGTRRVIKERSAYSALDLLRRVLLKSGRKRSKQGHSLVRQRMK
ncbi:MAG: competence/damage-inducible protein A [bacterium]